MTEASNPGETSNPKGMGRGQFIKTLGALLTPRNVLAIGGGAVAGQAAGISVSGTPKRIAQEYAVQAVLDTYAQRHPNLDANLILTIVDAEDKQRPITANQLNPNLPKVSDILKLYKIKFEEAWRSAHDKRTHNMGVGLVAGTLAGATAVAALSGKKPPEESDTPDDAKQPDRERGKKLTGLLQFTPASDANSGYPYFTSIPGENRAGRQASMNDIEAFLTDIGLNSKKDYEVSYWDQGDIPVLSITEETRTKITEALGKSKPRNTAAKV